MNASDFAKLDNNHKAAELVQEGYHGQNIQNLLNSMDNAQWQEVKKAMIAINDGMQHHQAGNGCYFPNLKFEDDGSISVKGHAVKDSTSFSLLENVNNALPSQEINTIVGER